MKFHRVDERVATFILDYLGMVGGDDIKPISSSDQGAQNGAKKTSSFIEKYCRSQIKFAEYLISHYNPMEMHILGDMHHGKCTTLIQDPNDKYIYKPTRADLLILLQNVLVILNEESMFDFNFVNIRRNNGADFIADFIETEPVKDVSKFSFHYGALILCLTLLRGIDFHKDNILCVNSTPVVVDCESLFYPNMEDTKAYNVEATLLLPTKYNDKSVINDQSMDFQEIAAGINEAALILYKNRARLKKIIKNGADIPIRLIFKPTHYYYSVLKNSLHPNYLRNYDARKKYITDCLAGKHIISKTIMQFEADDLVYLNMPYFSYFENKLYSSKGEKINQSFLSSPLIGMINSLNEIEYLKDEVLSKLEDQ